jgi:hypothetical protein
MKDLDTYLQKRWDKLSLETKKLLVSSETDCLFIKTLWTKQYCERQIKRLRKKESRKFLRKCLTN